VNHPVLLLVSISTITHRLLLLSRGLYFAAESKYCHKFAFNPKDGLRRDMQSWSERPESLDGERELFLTKLLIGNEIHMSRCPTLRAPPMDPITRQKYNTVTGDTSYKSSNGETSRSQVWIVYENGRAYPEYLVRYYRGEQDLERTPFVTQKDAETSVFHSTRLIPIYLWMLNVVNRIQDLFGSLKATMDGSLLMNTINLNWKVPSNVLMIH
jgi:hypothetical protein